MNESMSLLLAATILALGGAGLYLFKSPDENQSGGEDDYNEDSLFDLGSNTFGSSNLFNWGSAGNNSEDDDISIEPEEDYKPRKRGPKTVKNRKSSSNSKRRY